MKQFILFVAIATTAVTSFSQSLGYNELGILFGTDNNYGTARFNAMSGAFGALGGDISSIGINPAGAAVAKKSSFSVTLGNRNTNITSSYYGNSLNSQDDFFNISQAGGILSFDSAYPGDWSRFALSVNYRLKNDFDGNFSAQGNSGYALFNEHPDDATNQFDNAQRQNFNTITKGHASVLNFGFSAAHLNKLFVGATLSIHDINFSQTTRLNETNQDNNGNVLNAFNEQTSYFDGNGFSLGLGFIYKLHQNFRFGLAYETPTWHTEITEESNLNVFDPNNNRYDDWLGYTEISSSNINTDVNSGEEFNLYAFKLRTPSKMTASSAIIFGKQGLISIDYIYKDYRNTKITNGDFDKENKNFANDFNATHAINIGTEWRFDNMSLRGGYHYEQSPYKSALNSDHLKGFSAGLGYNFGNMKIDLSYRKSKNTSPYYIYNPNDVDPTELNNNTSRITGTITFSL